MGDKSGLQVHEERIERLVRRMLLERFKIVTDDRHFDTHDATLIAIASVSLAELLRRSGL